MEGEREGEKHQCVIASHLAPTGGCGPQPRHGSWPGIEPATLWFTACAQSTELYQPGRAWRFQNEVDKRKQCWEMQLVRIKFCYYKFRLVVCFLLFYQDLLVFIILNERKSNWSLKIKVLPQSNLSLLKHTTVI